MARYSRKSKGFSPWTYLTMGVMVIVGALWHNTILTQVKKVPMLEDIDTKVGDNSEPAA